MEDKTIAAAINNVASALRTLGMGEINSSSPGAIEGLAMEIKDGFSRLSDSIAELAQAVERLNEK